MGTKAINTTIMIKIHSMIFLMAQFRLLRMEMYKSRSQSKENKHRSTLQSSCFCCAGDASSWITTSVIVGVVVLVLGVLDGTT